MYLGQKRLDWGELQTRAASEGGSEFSNIIDLYKFIGKVVEKIFEEKGNSHAAQMQFNRIQLEALALSFIPSDWVMAIPRPGMAREAGHLGWNLWSVVKGISELLATSRHWRSSPKLQKLYLKYELEQPENFIKFITEQPEVFLDEVEGILRRIPRNKVRKLATLKFLNLKTTKVYFSRDISNIKVVTPQSM